MRAIVQRVQEAQVTVDGKVVGSCGRGLLVLLGVGASDTEQEARRLWEKIYKLRIFSDEQGKTNLSLGDVEGDLFVVSQFTLYANCRRGNRPSFTDAAPAQEGNRLYEYFCELAQQDVTHVGRGVFGAHMQVSLINDGPFTVWLDTEDLTRKR